MQRAAAGAADRLAEDICREPRGIFLARSRAAGWRRQARAARVGLEGQRATAEPPDGSQMARWQRDWAGLTGGGGQATDWTAGATAGGTVLIAALALLGWLLARPWPAIAISQPGAAVIGLVVAGLGAAWVGWAVATWRVRGLKRRWQVLADEQLNEQVRRQQRLGLARVYGRLEGDMAALQETLDGAIGELARWTASEGDAGRASGADGATEANEADDAGGASVSGAASVPGRASGANQSPAGQWSHLRRPLASEEIWQEAKARISQASEGNEKTRAALRRAWQAGDAKVDVGVGVDVDVVPSSADVAGREDDPSRLVGAILRAQLAGEEGSSVTGEKAAVADGLALAGALRRYAALATDFLCPTHRLLVDHAELVRQAAREYGIEQNLLGDGENAPLDVLEDLYGRAKPAGSYEITSTFARDTGDVEFGVTPEGSNSHLQRAAEQRGMPLLASHNPLSASLVRITGQLALQDLALFERGRRLYDSMR